MKLSAWIKEKGMTQDEFVLSAQAQGAGFSKHAVHKWCSGARIPRPEEMSFIFDITKNEVTPNDFYDLKISEGKLELRT